jgi:hypothetical protein
MKWTRPVKEDPEEEGGRDRGHGAKLEVSSG